MYLLIGLGNPGPKYTMTRHNAGFLVIDHIAQKQQILLDKNKFDCIYGKGKISGTEVFLAKPQTFMNLSGSAVTALVSFYKFELDRLLVIYDDLDLPLGTIRMKPAGSSGGHKGLTSIISLLGNHQIPRLRVGIGKPDNIPVVDYVLTPVKEEEKLTFQQVIELSATAGISFVTHGLDYTMNHFNRSIKREKAIYKNQTDTT